MRIEIEIPKEFEEHFKQDKFEDTLHRLNADAHLIAGNYEQETAIMLIKAFKESKTAYNVEKVVEELEENSSNYKKSYKANGKHTHKTIKAISQIKAIGIVRKGGAE